MGVEYALACERTGEAFDLGKGPWGEWQDNLPQSRDAVRHHLEDWIVQSQVASVWSRAIRGHYEDPPFEKDLPEWFDSLTNRIWTFIQRHPGCIVINDCSGDDFWHRPSPERCKNDDDLRRGGRVFHEIGSRYDVYKETRRER